MNPDNPEQLADQVADLLADPDRMLQFACNGQKAVRDELNWGKEKEFLLRFYRRMFDDRIPPDRCRPHRRRK